LFNHSNNLENENWETPEFVKIKNKKSKRLSPYLESEIWEKDELLSIIKHEPHKRNKAALTLFWDLNGRNHEITLLKLKHIRIKQNYAEGEVPHEAKTGSGPILLTMSFPFVRDWINEHPFRNTPDANLICNIMKKVRPNLEGRRTRAIAAGILYYYAITNYVSITNEEISRRVGVNPVTTSKLSKEVRHIIENKKK